MIEYYARWFYSQGRGIDPLTKASARARHAKPPGYVAMMTEDGRDPILLSIGVPGMSVNFMDSHCRVRLAYSFMPYASNDNPLVGSPIYLSHVQISEFDPERPEDKNPLTDTLMSFVEDGTVNGGRHVAGQKGAIEFTARYDISKHLDVYPEFGRYESIIRRVRDGYEPWLIANQAVS